MFKLCFCLSVSVYMSRSFFMSFSYWYFVELLFMVMKYEIPHNSRIKPEYLHILWMCCTCGLYHKPLNSSKWFCFSSPDTVPVRDGHHEGRLSGRRAERKQPNADVQQRATGQEKHGHLISQTWRVHTVFISMFHFLQYTSFMSLLKMLSVLDRDLWVFLLIKPVNKCSFICKSTRLVLLRSN